MATIQAKEKFVTSLPNAPVVFAKFLEQDILSEMGRLLFSVLNTFALNGYHVQLFNNIDLEQFDEERPYLQTIKIIDNLTIVDRIPENTGEMIYLFDQKGDDCAAIEWKKEVQVGFDIFSSQLMSSIRGVHPILMPYPMHPLLYGPTLVKHLKTARENPRKSRIFFSGDTQGYKRNRIQYPAPKLTRTEIVDTILERMNDRTLKITDAAALNNLQRGDFINKCVIVDNSSFRIDAGSWLDSISMGDFFLCPPGYVMPMCHNVIEAMAVGAIPVINYPEWLNPSLEDGINCVAFTDADDLVEKIDRILAMKPAEISKMKTRVIEYYENQLEPSEFINKLISINGTNVLLLMITDGCVAKNPTKLNKNSILITGSARLPGDIWRGFWKAFGI